MRNSLRTFMLQYLTASSTSEAVSLHLYDCVVATNCLSFRNLLEFLELLNLDFFPPYFGCTLLYSTHY